MFSAEVREGRIALLTDAERERAKAWCAKNEGARLEIAPVEESSKQRGYFEGCIVRLVAYYQEGMDHHSSDHRRLVREWLKLEFNADYVTIGGKSQLVAMSTKGRDALQAFLDRVQEWLIENYAPPAEATDTKAYKHWRDAVFPNGGPDNYVDYLISRKILK